MHVPPARTPAKLALLALAVLTAPALLPAASVAQTTQVPCTNGPAICPDLVVDPARLKQGTITTNTFSASSCSVVEGHVTAGTHRLLRFTFTTPNLGTGDLKVGAPSQHPEWFVWSGCHGHYHFREYADYRLWTLDGYAAWTAARAANPTLTAQQVLAANPGLMSEFVAGNKQGFCVIDIVRYGPLPARYQSCSSNQGITVGWADEYGSFLDGQWIVLDNVAPGAYMLEAEVNAERLYAESSYANNAAAVPVTV